MARRTKAEALETKERILDAAERIFFENGVARTSLEQIATEAQVTRGAVYWHFDSKAALLNALTARVRLPQEELIEKAANDGLSNPLELLENGAIEILRLIASDERRWRVYTIVLVRLEAGAEMAEVLEQQRQTRARFNADIARAFERAKTTGALDARWSPDIAARMFISLLGGLLTDWLRSDRSFDLVVIGEACIRELFCGFRWAMSGCSLSKDGVRHFTARQ